MLLNCCQLASSQATTGDMYVISPPLQPFCMNSHARMRSANGHRHVRIPLQPSDATSPPLPLRLFQILAFLSGCTQTPPSLGWVSSQPKCRMGRNALFAALLRCSTSPRRITLPPNWMCIVIVWAVEKLWLNLMAVKFEVFTNHYAL